MSTALVLRQLSKRYHGQPVVDRLSLTVAPGELVALLGPSGCGKTTTLRMVAGLTRPTAGRLYLDGRDVTPLPPEERGTAMVFQNHSLFPHMTVAGNVGFGLKMRGVPRAERARRIAQFLELVQLTGYGHRYPRELSGGQQQRVALARALVIAPRLFLLDEPLSNLDPALREDMQGLVRRLHRESGTTTVLVTHSHEEAAMLADRVALIMGGRLQQYGPPEDFYERPANECVARFFGANNFLHGRLEGSLVVTEAGPLRLGRAASGHGEVTLTIRPERIRFWRDPLPAPNVLTGRIAQATYAAAQMRYQVSVGTATLTVLTEERAPEGELAHLYLPPEHLWVLPNQELCAREVCEDLLLAPAGG